MISLHKKINFPLILLSLLPLSIVFGSSISLINTLLISLYLPFIYFINKKIHIYDKKPIIAMSALCLYLLFNSFISLDFNSGAHRNFGFIRFILFFVVINYLFFKNNGNTNFIKFWGALVLIVLVDVYIERFSGSNILGYGKIEIDGVLQPYGPRVVSFFKTEPIPGAFICGFSFIIFGYFLNFIKQKNLPKIIGFLIILFCLTGIILTGERSNGLKAIIGTIFFIFIIDYVKLRDKLLVFISFLTVFFLIVSFSEYIKVRYIDQLYNQLDSKEKREKFYDKNVYLKLYKSGFQVFKNYPLIGVGNKNYRIETCDNKKNIINKEYYCLTHPHQIYFELLSEHGIFGTIIILSIFFYLKFRILRKIISDKNFIQAGTFVFLIINFLPILPSGSFFSDFNLTLFMINFSLMYAVNKNTNIFYKSSK